MLTGKARARYERENLVSVRVTFNRNTEPDLVKLIERQHNKAGYIKRLMHKEIRQKTGLRVEFGKKKSSSRKEQASGKLR